MGMSDTLGDMISRIRNAQLARHGQVSVPASVLKERVAAILKKEGFIEDVSRTEEDKPTLLITLRYGDKHQPAIQKIRRVSKPGQRQYARHDHIPRVCSGLGVSIVSTSKGLMTDRQARVEGVGGEILCEVW